jgi:type IV secretory pathway TrbD component
MALRLTQPVTEMSTRNILRGKNRIILWVSGARCELLTLMAMQNAVAWGGVLLVLAGIYQFCVAAKDGNSAVT